MKIDGVVVLYNPTEKTVKNILEYAPLLNKLYVIDNSDCVNDSVINQLSKIPNVEIAQMNCNKGIATALRIGTDKAIEDGADFCLTMDQDGVFPISRMPDFIKYLASRDIDDYGMIGVRIPSLPAGEGLIVTKTIITSYSFINIKNYMKTSGFRDELFIDSVDTELCHQFYKIGKKVAYIGEILIEHLIGTPCIRKFFGIKITVTNHSPLRCYYRFRNNYVLYREDKKFYKETRIKDRHQILKILFFEKNKLEKFKMIRRGRKDAKLRKLGRYPK